MDPAFPLELMPVEIDIRPLDDEDDPVKIETDPRLFEVSSTSTTVCDPTDTDVPPNIDTRPPSLMPELTLTEPPRDPEPAARTTDPPEPCRIFALPPDIITLPATPDELSPVRMIISPLLILADPVWIEIALEDSTSFELEES